jgi:hypothetical protein
MAHRQRIAVDVTKDARVASGTGAGVEADDVMLSRRTRSRSVAKFRAPHRRAPTMAAERDFGGVPETGP